MHELGTGTSGSKNRSIASFGDWATVLGCFDTSNFIRKQSQLGYKANFQSISQTGMVFVFQLRSFTMHEKTLQTCHCDALQLQVVERAAPCMAASGLAMRGLPHAKIFGAIDPQGSNLLNLRRCCDLAYPCLQELNTRHVRPLRV